MMSEEEQRSEFGVQKFCLNLQNNIDENSYAIEHGMELKNLGLNFGTRAIDERTLTKEFQFYTSEPVARDDFNNNKNVKEQNYSKFEVETLMYIFYNMPRDVNQIRAANELSWEYHRPTAQWYLTETNSIQHFDTQVWKKVQVSQIPSLDDYPITMQI